MRNELLFQVRKKKSYATGHQFELLSQKMKMSKPSYSCKIITTLIIIKTFDLDYKTNTHLVCLYKLK